jgi:hypothetical protein
VGLFSVVKNVAKARMMGGLLRRGFGGRVGTAMMLAYFGKMAYDAAKTRRARRMAVNTGQSFREPYLPRESR